MNGTYVGGEAVDATRILRDGDKIFVGDSVLRFALAPILSIGIAVCPADSEDATELLARADAALYRAKAAGKNRVAI